MWSFLCRTIRAPDMLGRQFRFLALLAGLWCAGRIMMGELVPEAQHEHKPDTVMAQYSYKTTPQQISLRASAPQVTRTIRSAGRRRADVTIGDRLPASTLNSAPPEALMLPRSTARAPELQGLLTAFAPPGNTRTARTSTLHFYGYSFFRKPSSAGLSALNGQYGGSQSGFGVTWDIDRHRQDRDVAHFAVLARGAIAHGDTSERELAAGLRWRPLTRVPVSLSVERRFRHARPDANAVYLAGGTSLALPQAFRLDTFAQAGIVSGREGGPFFDFSAQTDRTFFQHGEHGAGVGAGIWGGGQSDIFRIDIGPTVRTDIAISEGYLRVRADWRFRVAGEALPASGPAMTLSTSF
jgi:hypothetical protein